MKLKFEKLPKKVEKLTQDEKEIEQEFNLKKKYQEMVKVLVDVDVLELLPKAQEIGIIGIDGKEYPLPTYKEIISKMAERKDFLLKKKEQGFTELLITPFGMSLKTLIARAKKLIIKKHEQGKLLGTNGKSLEIDKDPVYLEYDYEQGNADDSGELVYDIKKFDKKNNGGKTKKEILESKKEDFPGYHVMLIEDLLDLPIEGRGKEKSGRKQLETNISPETCLELLQKEDQYNGETGLTPEDHLSCFIYYLKKNNQVIGDWDGKGKACYNINSCFNSLGLVPLSFWGRNSRKLSLGRCYSHLQSYRLGGRSSVRI